MINKKASRVDAEKENKPMPALFEIRADFSKNSIVVYQAFSKSIALPVLEAQKLVSPFSVKRMTWIKPSFLWLMERSHWGQKKNQEYILAIHITRSGWEKALSHAVLTAPNPKVYKNHEDWQKQFQKAIVHVQWDPERSIRGKKLAYRSIQIGLGQKIIREFAQDWIVSIQNYTPLSQKIYALCQAGKFSRAKPLLPKERPYPLPDELTFRLGMKS